MWSNISPAARIMANFVAMIAVVLVNDPYTPAMFLLVSLGLALWTGVLRGRKVLRLIPFGFFAFAMFWMNAAWANVTDATVVATMGPAGIYRSGNRRRFGFGPTHSRRRVAYHRLFEHDGPHRDGP